MPENGKLLAESGIKAPGLEEENPRTAFESIPKCEVNKLKVTLTLKTLVDLQDCDIRLSDIQSKKESCPVKIQALKDSLSIIEKELERELEQHEAHTLQKKQAEQSNPRNERSGGQG